MCSASSRVGKGRNETTRSRSRLSRRRFGSARSRCSVIALWAIQIAPIVEKLTANARYDGHWARIAASRSSLAFGGRPISRTRSVIAMAKTPSLNASIRAVPIVVGQSRTAVSPRVAGRAGSSAVMSGPRPPASPPPSRASARRRPTLESLDRPVDVGRGAVLAELQLRLDPGDPDLQPDDRPELALDVLGAAHRRRTTGPAARPRGVRRARGRSARPSRGRRGRRAGRGDGP